MIFSFEIASEEHEWSEGDKESLVEDVDLDTQYRLSSSSMS